MAEQRFKAIGACGFEPLHHERQEAGDERRSPSPIAFPLAFPMTSTTLSLPFPATFSLPFQRPFTVGLFHSSEWRATWRNLPSTPKCSVLAAAGPPP